MVQAVSFSNVPAYREFYTRWQSSGTNCSFIAWCEMKGYATELYRQLENYIETGDPYHGKDEIDTINECRQVSNGYSTLFQSQDDETFYEFDWNSGTYNTIKGIDEAAKLLGYEGTNAETLTLGYNSAVITDYKFGNLDDGQDATSSTLTSSKYGTKTKFVSQEFDLDYIFNTLLADPSDPQYAIAKNIFDNLVAHASQWMTDADFETLAAVAEEYGETSVQYKDALKNIILARLDEGEWNPNHSHVHNTSTVNLDGTISDNSEGDTTEGTVLNYKKDEIILLSNLDLYYNNIKGYVKVDEQYRESSSTAERDREMAKVKGLQYATNVLDSLISSLQSKLGAEYTEEIDKYAQKAKQNVLGKNDIIDVDYVNKDQYDVNMSYKKVIDYFFSEFDTMCKNKGKTNSEVAAEKAQKEKEIKEKTDSFKTLYNMNMASVASEAGIKSSYQVVNAESANDFKDEAEENIIEPLKSRIKSKLSGSKIPSTELEAILKYATETALANPMDWATQDNEYKYTINTSKVVDLFEKAVKSAIKQKGYKF